MRRSAAEPQPNWEGEAPAEPSNASAARRQGSTGISPSQEICAACDDFARYCLNAILRDEDAAPAQTGEF